MNTQFITSFIGELSKATPETDEQYSIVESVRVVLDTTSPPEKVTEACESIGASTDWLAAAFNLDNGQKVLKSACDHAERRVTQTSVLVSVDTAANELMEISNTVKEDGKCDAEFGKRQLGLNQSQNYIVLQ